MSGVHTVNCMRAYRLLDAVASEDYCQCSVTVYKPTPAPVYNPNNATPAGMEVDSDEEEIEEETKSCNK